MNPRDALPAAARVKTEAEANPISSVNCLPPLAHPAEQNAKSRSSPETTVLSIAVIVFRAAEDKMAKA